MKSYKLKTSKIRCWSFFFIINFKRKLRVPRETGFWSAASVMTPLWRNQSRLCFGNHDQERVHTSVNRSCVLALRSVTYFDNRESQLVQLWSMMADIAGVFLVPGTSWISGRTSIYFHPMSDGQVKNYMLVYFCLTRTSYLVTGQVKILRYLPGGQVKFFRFFCPCIVM